MGIGLDPIGVIFMSKDMASANAAKVERSFKSVDNTTDKVAKSFSANMKTMGMGLAAVGASAVVFAGLNGASKVFEELQTGIAEVSTLIEGTPQELDMLTNSTVALSNSYGTRAVDQAKAYYSAISAGVGGVAEAQNFLEIANKTAIGGVTDAETAIDGLTTVTNAFTNDNVTAQQAADGLFVAMKAGKTTIGQLSSKISLAAPNAAALGVHFDELLGATSALTTGGVPTAQAFTKINAVFTAFLSKQDIAKKMGPEVAKAFSMQNLKSKGLRNTLLEVDKALGGDKEKMQKLMGSSEALGAVLSLTGGQAGKFEEIMGLMANKTGEADLAFEKMSKTAAFQGKRFDSLSESLVIMVGKAFSPIKAVVLGVANSFLELIASIPQDVIDFFVKTVSFIAGVVGLAGAILFLKGAFAILSIMGGTVLLALKPIILTILAIAAAIGILVAAYKSNFGGFGDFINEMFTSVKLIFQALYGVISNGEISAELYQQLKDVGLLGFVETVLQLFYKVKAFMSGLFDGFMAAFTTIVEPVFSMFVSAIKRLIESVGQIFTEVLSLVNKLMGGTNDLTGAMGMMEGAGMGIGATFGTVIGVILDGFLLILTFAINTITFVVSLGSAIITTINLLADMIGSVGTFLSELFVSPQEAGLKFISALKNAWDGFVSSMAKNKIVGFIMRKLGYEGPEETKETSEKVVKSVGIKGPEANDPSKTLADNVLKFPSAEEIKERSKYQGRATGLNIDLPKASTGIENVHLANLAQLKARKKETSKTVGAIAESSKKQDSPINITSRLILDGRQVAESTNRLNERERIAQGGQN